MEENKSPTFVLITAGIWHVTFVLLTTAILIFDRGKMHTGEKTTSSTTNHGKHVEEWNYTCIYHLAQKLYQVYQRHQFETWKVKIARRKHRQYPMKYRYTKGCMNKTPSAQELRSTTDNWYLIKLKRFCVAMATINRVKKKPTKLKGTFCSYTSYRGLISGIFT